MPKMGISANCRFLIANCFLLRCNIPLPHYIQNEILMTKSDDNSFKPDADSPLPDPRYIGLCLPSKLEYIFYVSWVFYFFFYYLISRGRYNLYIYINSMLSFYIAGAKAK